MKKNQPKDNFTIIPNEIITDSNITSGALRVYLYVSSKPTEWNIFNADIQKQLGIKKERTLSLYWRNLLDNGYIFREKVMMGSDLSQEHKVGSFVYTIPAIKVDTLFSTCTKKEGQSNTKPYSKKDSIATSNDVTEVQSCFDEFNELFSIQSREIGLFKTTAGNKRRNSGTKLDALTKYENKRKVYSFEVISIIVRNDLTGKSPKDFINLLGRAFPIQMAKRLKKVDVKVLTEALNSNNKDFLLFIKALEETI